MKQAFLIIYFLLSFLCANAQRDSILIAQKGNFKALTDISEPNISIYPVPVRENVFTIKSSKEISSIKITNIIGQDIFRANYNDPLLQIKIILDNPQRGMYLVAIYFSDKTRTVKKVMIEGII